MNEPDEASGVLELGYVTVEIEAIDAFEFQDDVVLEDLRGTRG
jgi:hypothetical protein